MAMEVINGTPNSNNCRAALKVRIHVKQGIIY